MFITFKKEIDCSSCGYSKYSPVYKVIMAIVGATIGSLAGYLMKPEYISSFDKWINSGGLIKMLIASSIGIIIGFVIGLIIDKMNESKG